MVELTQEQYDILKENYQFAQEIRELQEPLTKQEIRELQEPLTKQEITHLRKLIKAKIEDGYSNYLRLVSIYSIDRDIFLGIYVKKLYHSLQE